MAITEIPPARSEELHDVPVLLVQLQDDLTRSRLREAFWISLVVHLCLVIAAVTSPRWITFSKPIPVRTAEELIRGKELTYLDLPHDMQHVEKRPDANTISDKNRIATSKHPTLDHRALEQLRDVRPPGAPGRGGAPAAPQPMPTPQVAQAQPNPPANNGPRVPQTPPPQTQQEAKLTPPNPFSRPSTPGSAIEEAARATASGRGGGGYGGASGDYGLGASTSRAKVQGNLEILSDTMGVDFGPYLSRVLHDVRINWYNLIPEVARAPLMKRGKVAIEFAITRDGKIAGLHMAGTSGDVSLDRAAWGGITASNPFPPLPGDFRGDYLALRFYFLYNPEKNELQ